MLLKSAETKQLREELLRSKWLYMNEDVAYWKVLASTSVMEIKILENTYLKLEINSKVMSVLYYLGMRSQENRS
jgi:hypothetical protein